MGIVLQEGSKSNLPGVWDPVPGEEKHILIKYTFMNHSHQVGYTWTYSVLIKYYAFTNLKDTWTTLYLSSRYTFMNQR